MASDFRRCCIAEIDREAIKHNLNRVRELALNSKVMAVIKGDGYGHDMDLVVSALLKSNNPAEQFAVTDIADWYRLRQQGVSQPITLLSAQLEKTEIESLIEDFREHGNQNEYVVYDWSQIDTLKQFSNQQTGLSVWIKLDTGMGRLGFAIAEYLQVKQQLEQLNCIDSIRLMTHLANADQPNKKQNSIQLEQFQQLVLDNQPCKTSVYNSAGICGQLTPEFDLVRPGVMLYGVSPLLGVSAEELDLKPAMTLKSELISVKSLPAGSSIGYAGTAVLQKDSLIGVVACGYADGYPRHAPTGTRVLVNGQTVQMLGRVSMDMIVVDLTDTQAKVGDQAVLWGKDNPIESLADACGTISYEILCGIPQRVKRIAIN